MKRINVFYNLLSFLFFISILFPIIDSKNNSLFDYIMLSLAEVIFFFGIFNIYSYNEDKIVMQFLVYKKNYYFKDIIEVHEGKYNTYILVSTKNLSRLRINLMFQKKRKKELFEMIKKCNSNCKFFL